MQLLCAKNEAQLALLIRNGDVGNGNSRIVPLMPKVALAMHRLGFKGVKLPIEFLDRSECEAIQDQAIELSRSWFRNFNTKVEFRGIDLLECCRLEMMAFFQDVLAAEAITPRLLREYAPESALFFTVPSVPSFDNHMHDGTSDVFEAVLQWRFRKAGIKLVFPRAPLAQRVVKRIGGKTALLSRIAQKGRNLLRNRSIGPRPPSDPRRIGLADLPRNKPLLVGFGSGYDLLIVWSYLNAFAQEVDGFPVVVNKGPNFNPATLRSGLTLDDDFRFLFVNDIPLSTEDSLNLGIPRRSCMAALKGGDLLPKSLQNPLLNIQFSFFWDSIVTGAYRAARRASGFFASHDTCLYLDDYCTGYENRAWAEAGNLAGVPTVTVPHGAVNQVEFFHYLTKFALAWGELGAENWRLATPEKASHVLVSGDPSMETLRTSFSQMAGPQRNRVILMTGGFLHQAWADMDLHGLLYTWEEIASIARQRPAIEFIIKPHPSVRDLGSWYVEFVEKAGLPNLRIIGDQRLEELLPPAFLAILVGKVGTAGLVAALAHVPFVFLDTMVCRHIPGFRLWRDEKNGVSRVTDPRQLLELIDKAYRDPHERELLLESCQRFSNLYLQPFEPGKICREIGLFRHSDSRLYPH